MGISERAVLVTGATGNVGREVVRALLSKGVRVRAADRDPTRSQGLFGEGVESVRLDFRDPATFSVARGADALFLMRPPAIADVEKTLVPFLDTARSLGVQHVVFLSVAGAEKNRLVPHHAVEQHLAKSTGWTVLRPGFFAQNFGDAYRRDIVEDRRVYVPAGRGRVAFVDVRDLAELAAIIFASPREHERRGYTLTGGEAIDFTCAASCLSEALGRLIRYEAASILGYARHLRQRGMPWAQVGVQTILHAGLRFGQAERVDPTLEALLERRPRTVHDYVHDHRELWLGPTTRSARDDSMKDEMRFEERVPSSPRHSLATNVMVRCRGPWPNSTTAPASPSSTISSPPPRSPTKSSTSSRTPLPPRRPRPSRS